MTFIKRRVSTQYLTQRSFFGLKNCFLCYSRNLQKHLYGGELFKKVFLKALLFTLMIYFKPGIFLTLQQAKSELHLAHV